MTGSHFPSSSSVYLGKSAGSPAHLWLITNIYILSPWSDTFMASLKRLFFTRRSCMTQSLTTIHNIFALLYFSFAFIAQVLIIGLPSRAPSYLIFSLRWTKTEKVHSVKLGYANWQQQKICRPIPIVYLYLAQHKLWPGFNMAKD